MVPMVQTHAHLDTSPLGGGDHRQHLGRVAGGGLFHQHVLAGLDRGQRDLGERVVQRRDDDHVDTRHREQGAPVAEGQRLGTLLTDEAATDDANAKTHLSPHVRFLSRPAMRPSV